MHTSECTLTCEWTLTSEWTLQAEVDEMNRLIQEREEADKRAEMIRREADRLQGTDFDM